MALLKSFRAVMLSLSIVGTYLTWYLISKNGTAAQLRSFQSLEFLPGTDVPLRQHFTGITAIDRQLKFLNCIVWSVTDGNSPGVLLHAYLFFGQFAAAYGLLMIEGVRSNNFRHPILYTMISGILVQRCGWAATGSLLSLLHLSTSPTITPSKSNTAVEGVDSLSIVIAIACGYVLPTVLVGLPTPSTMTHNEKQLVMALWQVFPIWVALVHYIVRQVLGGFVPNTAAGPVATHRGQDMNGLRFAYSFLMLVAGVTHIHAWSLSLTASLLPHLFAAHIAEALHCSNAFLPTTSSPSAVVPNVTSGVALLLQWDEIIGGTALFLWTLALYIQAKYQKGGSFTLRLCLQLLIGTTFAGPTTGAAALMWARDELISDHNVQPVAKKVL